MHDLAPILSVAGLPPRAGSATNESRASRSAGVCGKCGDELGPEDHVWKDAVWRGFVWVEVPSSHPGPNGVRPTRYRQRIAAVCARCRGGGDWVDRRCPHCNRTVSVRLDDCK